MTASYEAQWDWLRYVYPFYKEGASPERVLGADERMYSQCKRIQIVAGHGLVL